MTDAQESSMLSPDVLRPMEARLAAKLPIKGDWQFEPKWDGFRCLAFRVNDRLDLRSKSGNDLTRYFPEVSQQLRNLRRRQFVLDGELLVPVGEHLSFEQLQLRLHPSRSRIHKLSLQSPAIFMAFDILESGRRPLLKRPLSERRAVLEEFFVKLGPGSSLRLSPFSRRRSDAVKWLKRVGGGALDGVIAKPLKAEYLPGQRVMLKVKCFRTADCVVGGFRYATQGRFVGSILLGLYNCAGKLDHVGFTSAFAEEDRPSLTKRLERLRGGQGFTGNGPGGRSRWSTDRGAEWIPLKAELVAEIQYDQITGRRFRHGTRFLRWRPDKAARQCTFDQLECEARPSVIEQAAFK